MARRARRWCDYCNAVVPSEKNGGWTCLRCENFTHPLWSVKTAQSVGAALGSIPVGRALGVVLGLAVGILVSVTTDVPLAPEGGLVLGALVGWLSRRGSA